MQHKERLVDLRDLFRLTIVDLDALRMIDEDQLVAVRRPEEAVTIAGAEGGEFLLVTRAIGAAQGELVLPALVTPVGNELAIRRPGWIALGRSRAVGEVAKHTFFGREGEDLSSRRYDGALAGGRDIGGLDPLADILKTRLHTREVGHEIDVDFLGRLRLERHTVESAACLENQIAGPMAGKVTSKSANRVICRISLSVSLLATSRAHMLERSPNPRSERKYRVEPCHIGWASFASLLVRLRASRLSRSNSQISGAMPPRYRFQLRKPRLLGVKASEPPSVDNAPNSP